MNHLDLFSGIGGFALAAQWVWGNEHEIVSFVEIDSFCQKVLKKHWPDVPIISDIRDVTYEKIMADTNSERCFKTNRRQIHPRETQGDNACDGSIRRGLSKTKTIDLLTGGFPCQPFSVAGKQGGKKDDRYLWPEMLRVIREIRPTWIIGENVAGIINLALDEVLSDLEDSEYEVQPFLIPACGVDAPHRRERVWIVAHSINGRSQIRRPETDGEMGRSPGRGEASMHISATAEESSLFSKLGQDVADTKKGRLQGGKKTGDTREGGEKPRNQLIWGCDKRGGANWFPEPNVGRVANGVPNRVDRLKSLGNAVVPQVVVPIMQAIKATDLGCVHLLISDGFKKTKPPPEDGGL